MLNAYPMNNRIILASLFLLAVPVDAEDTTVRLSLLRDAAPRAILDDVLAQAGCTKPTRRAFFRVIKIYNESPRYACEGFGVKVDGWFRFTTPRDLLRKMPYPSVPRS